MQLLSKVKYVEATEWGLRPAMLERPALSPRIAHCIGQWAEIEAMLGAFTALLLHANDEAVLAIYTGLENRASQLKMISSAIDSILKERHADIANIIIKDQVKPAMKMRDRLAHWCWGLCDDLPDALLIREPSSHLESFYQTLKITPVGTTANVHTDHSTIFVIREGDLIRFSEQLSDLQLNLRYLMGSVWQINPPEIRDSLLQKLSTQHPIPEGLRRLNEARQKNQKAPPSQPEEDLGE